jgi:hypothetical protein
MRSPLALLLALFLILLLAACSAGDDDDSTLPADGDAADDDSANGGTDDDDNDDNDDTSVDDDATDDDDDSSPLPDDYLAPWPQNNVMPHDYDESPAAGPMRQKAEDYDLWHLNNHQPYYGDTVGVLFTDDARTTPQAYYDWGDSCEWTGLYLGSQAARYYVTGDAQARANAIRVAQALDGNLHITDTPGFIARYRGQQDPLIYQGDDWCEAEGRCHHVETGPYAGDFWWGETSRDMYSGWFFGMSLAYDLLDDEATRAMIRDDVSEVLNTLIAHNWLIIDEEGQPTDAGPNVLPPFRISWLTVGYHITGEETIKAELQKWLRNESRLSLRLASISFFNRYTEYFGNCLSHETWYNLLRLAKVYYGPDDYQFLLRVFNEQVDTFTKLSHNPWFTSVYMGQGGYEPSGARDPYQDQLEQDLADFPAAPHFRYYLPAKDPSTYELDPVSVFLHDLEQQLPFLADLIGTVDYQALDPFPVSGYCASDFIFQWSPFVIHECGEDNPAKVDPGVDYLIPYWLASYHKFITKDQ